MLIAIYFFDLIYLSLYFIFFLNGGEIFSICLRFFKIEFFLVEKSSIKGYGSAVRKNSFLTSSEIRR